MCLWLQISSGFACSNGCNSCGGYLTCYPRYLSDSCYCCKPVLINCKGNGCGGGVDYKLGRNAVNRTFVGQSIPNKVVKDEAPISVVEQTDDIQVTQQYEKIQVYPEAKTVEGNELM